MEQTISCNILVTGNIDGGKSNEKYHYKVRYSSTWKNSSTRLEIKMYFGLFKLKKTGIHKLQRKGAGDVLMCL